MWPDRQQNFPDRMKPFDPSSLWRISEFRQARIEGRLDLEPSPGRATLLPTTLLADLRRIRSDAGNGDVLEVIAACVRHHEAALLYLEQGQFVWPVTLFPREGLYHSPRDAASMAASFALSQLRLVSAEPPGVRAPGSGMHERVASPDKYHPLTGLLWTVAIHGPRPDLLTEIHGRAAYRVVAANSRELPPLRGAISSTVLRLERQSASLQEIARWPGMTVERASRILNGLYLSGTLLVSRAHPAARGTPVRWRDLLGRRK
ncbi:MAG TPA: hypothetical protein VH041_09155 [Caldimonas sp.]|nr:hypothetical protein [Caldimonas sp.]HEX4234464.1 hypothetical protein [Caldimonas sp.]